MASHGAGVSAGRTGFDRRAVLVGGVVQAVACTLLYYAAGPLAAAVPTLGVGGLLAGVLSRRYDDVFVDAGVATAVGAVLSVAGYLALVWVGTAGLPTWIRFDALLAAAGVGLFVAILALPVVCAAGAVVGSAAAQASRAVR